MILGAELLSFNILVPSVSPTLAGLTLPVCNGIRLKPASLIGNTANQILYGDTTNMGTYGTLDLIMGEPTGTTFTTYTTGYTYIYDIGSETFKITDNNGTVVSIKTNVKSIADLMIDFTVFENHAFEIRLGSAFGTGEFFLNSTLQFSGNSFIYMDKMVWGNIDEYYESVLSTIRPNIYKNIGDIDINDIVTQIITNYLVEEESMDGLGKGDASLSVGATFPFYVGIDDVKNATISPTTVMVNKIEFSSYVIPLLTVSLFPQLFPAIATNELINNRPVYEPWMVWELYKLIYNIVSNNPNPTKSGLSVFDLSPMW